jgi:diguanylate cyclase (GGDEF)-like protein/PAS domain S-box-containing protein
VITVGKTDFDSFLTRPRGLLTVGLCVSLLLPVLFAVLLWLDLGHDDDQAADRADIVAQSIQRELDHRLGAVAGDLRAIADAPAQADSTTIATGTPPAAAPLLQDVVVLPDRGVHGTDLQGHPADASWLPPPERLAPPASLSIGPPLRPTPGARWMVPVAWYGHPGRRVAALIDADWFADVLQGYPLGDGAVLNLVHANGTMLARSKANQSNVGTDLRHARIFDSEYRGRSSGRLIDTSSVDHVRRLVVFLRMEHTPLIVVVGTARYDIVAVWWPYALGSFGVAVLFAGMWLWLNRAFGRSHAAQGRLLDELRVQSARGEEARRIASLGDWLWNLETGEVFWSPEVFTICGVPFRDGPLRIEEIPALMHPDDRERMLGYLGRARTEGRLDETQYRIVRPSDGAVRTLYARAEWADRTPGRRMLRGIQQDITELAQARARLGEAERQYRFLFEHNPLPMWVYDRGTLEFIAVNDAMLTSYGYSREELLRGTTLDIRPPEDAQALRATANGDPEARPQGSVWTHLRKDGSRLRAEVHACEISFEGRSAWLVLALDVTERERSEQRFQLIARATSDAIWDWDIPSQRTWRSENAYALFGYTAEEMGSTPNAIDTVLHPDDRVRIRASIDTALASDRDEWEESYRLLHRDGSYVEVLDRGLILRDAEGRALRMIGGMLDVTQRNRDVMDLRLLRRAVESADNGIVIADARQPDLPAVYANRAFERMTGYGADEVIGSSFHLLSEAVESEPFEVVALRRAIAEQREIRVLLRDRRKDGQMFWNDFYLAPVRDEAGTLTHFVSIQSDVSERQRAQEQLAFRATHDELTGLPNRQLLVDRLQQALINAERHGRSIVVLFVDLDDFKLINDSLGHTAGDETLRMVAQRLSEAVAESDTVARFGGDEFVILLSEHTDEASVEQAIAGVNAALSRPFDIAGSTHYIGASIGWCRSPEAGTVAEALLMRADLAMYKAKQGGRNRATAYQPSFDSQVSARLHMVSELRSALERGEFVLAFQPLFDIDGAPVALEALVRWQHPERGLLPPGQFIGVCEESGLIVPLGRWVLDEAMRHHALLAAAGLGRLRIAVNISSLHFQQDLYADVETAMRAHGVPRGVLELELTESVIMGNPEAAIDVMRRLDGIGVAISVDDFGTGYSSLSYLKRLPIDRLKIDRSFVRDLGRNDDDEAICNSIIRLAHSLGLHTVAEGVETQAQLDWLHARGCDEVQGFLLAQPLPFAQALAGLKKEKTVSA